MNFDIPQDLADYLKELDEFIEQKIKPLQAKDDNERFFDHRREDARTDWHRGGLPNEEWEDLLLEAKRLADEAGHFRYSSPKEYGGRDGTNLGMAIIREHLAVKGLGLHNDLQNEHSIVGNNVGLLLMINYGTEQQKAEWIDDLAERRRGFAFGITEPEHGSDATHMETNAHRDGDDWVINGSKTWNTGIHKAKYDMIMARTSGKPGDGDGITAFLTPTDAKGFKVEEMLWTFNMPTDHGRISLTDVRVSNDAIFGGEGRGLQVVQHFFNENRIRQAASSLGAAQFCINESVEYAKIRAPFGKPLSTNQGIQFPLVELQTQCEMLRALVHKTAWQMDKYGAFSVSDKVSMCNYWSNRLCCEAADQAMQVHGGMGYSRHKPFEHIYRHHRRYRITEGSEEIQKRRVAGYMFGFMSQRTEGSEGIADMSAVPMDKLAAILKAHYPGFQTVVSCDRLSGGASQETYCIVIQGASGEEKLAMRRQAGGVFQTVANDRCGLKVEAELMRAVRPAGVPAPEIYHVLTREDDIGDGFIMQWLEGEALGSRIVKIPELNDIRPKLAGLFGEAAARIHSVDLHATGLYDKLPTQSPEEYVNQTWDRYKVFDTPQPMIDYVGTWLIDHLPTDYEPCLVHNDYRNGNVMVNNEGLVAVIDWEIAHIGDPMRDLGWVCTNSWRYSRSDLPAGGVGTREDLFAGYERVSGKKVDPDHVKFWEVFGSFWWAISTIGMAINFRVGLDKSVERAAIGRRTSECQVDCANLLMPGPVEMVPEVEPGPDLEVPQAGELLQGVEELLHGTLMDETKGRTNFLARVAGNALSTVRRELQLGPEARRRELDRLQNVLGMKGDLAECRWQLVHGLRDRTIGLDTPGLTEHLRNAVTNQIAIDNPRYSGLSNALANNKP